MGYLGRRIGLSQDKGDSTPGGADGAVGGGILDLFASGYFQRQGNIYNAPGAAPPSGLTATGGIISDYTDGPAVYRAHIFTSSGTFDVTAPGTFGDTVEYLVVAGGGGGGGGFGGAGGAGGLRTNVPGVQDAATNPLTASAFPVSTSPGSYTVTVGAGGAGGVSKSGNPGGNSVFGTITSHGGGRGGGNPGTPGPDINADNGGSGGSGGMQGGVGTSGSGNTPPFSPPQGNDGGASYDVGTIPGNNSGGGGGAGAAGSDGTASPGGSGGAGGIGVQVLIAGPPASSQPVGTPGPSGTGWFAGGGGGHSGQGQSPTSGGAGGGGAGGVSSPDPSPGKTGGNATQSTGGGGGAAGGPSNTANPGGNGASGIVVVRYQIAQLTADAKATGGVISFYNGKTIHTFTSSGTFATTSDWSAADVEYVVVGGGGGGGVDAFSSPRGGGGGGAGGYRTGTTPIGAHPVSTTIQIGAGGGAGSPASVAGLQGGASYFGTPITADGGGFGGGHTAPAPRVPAAPYSGTGSGGGGTSGPGSEGYGGPGGTYGNDGSAGTTPQGAGGGGGGAGGAGGPNDRITIRTTDKDTGGYGGIGVQLPTSFRDPISGVGAPGPSGNYWVAGGGGGKGITGGAGGGPGAPPTGWAGGGPGATSPDPGSVAGTNGLENTGGGGGGGGGPTAAAGGGSGGSGIVLIAYPT